MNKKAIEITMSTIVIAAICLVVLVVLIAIFTKQTGDVSKSFSNISTGAGDKAEESMWNLNNLFGCKEEDTKCRGNE
jgi:lipopolysaccharide/colanic/teichoic acid biosynthesis glycosyltransferase|tara:strand:- start:1876 stop:2106 length:231 start_codon:yes stop_codon:yes gene_type:complete